MVNLVVVLPKLEDADRIRNILMRSGMTGIFSCNSGANAISLMNELNDGILISAYRLADMTCLDLKADMPAGFQMLVMASENVIAGLHEPDILYLTMPFKVHELIGTLEMMMRDAMRRRKKQRGEPKQRTDEEKELIRRAKALLEERNHMTEEEAHRYIQKCSMDSGTNLVETAQMILAMY